MSGALALARAHRTASARLRIFSVVEFTVQFSSAHHTAADVTFTVTDLVTDVLFLRKASVIWVIGHDLLTTSVPKVLSNRSTRAPGRSWIDFWGVIRSPMVGLHCIVSDGPTHRLPMENRPC